MTTEDWGFWRFELDDSPLCTLYMSSRLSRMWTELCSPTTIGNACNCLACLFFGSIFPTLQLCECSSRHQSFCTSSSPVCERLWCGIELPALNLARLAMEWASEYCMNDLVLSIDTHFPSTIAQNLASTSPFTVSWGLDFSGHLSTTALISNKPGSIFSMRHGDISGGAVSCAVGTKRS